ncbi:MAG: protein kinase [Polyangiaceae bacterium]
MDPAPQRGGTRNGIAPSPLAPGKMVNDHVRLIELLGKGGMGTVWLADHLALEARVAVKFIAPELVGRHPSLRERFKREASICARIRSIHVVQTFDLGEMVDGSPYIVMELLEGTTLTERVESQGPMEIYEVGMMVQQVAKVLQRAHVLGIVHRDIKPDNLFLTSDSDYDLFVKVLDFGIAKQTRVGHNQGRRMVTKTGAVVGTPEFMSPEQAIASKDLDHRSDLFSLAVSAFYAYTGELPFDPEAEMPLWLQMSNERHRPASYFRPDAFDGLDEWFERALRAKPEDRFATARDMANSLSGIISNNTSQILDELSSGLEDSLSLPRAEAMSLRERLEAHLAGHVDISPESEAEQVAPEEASEVRRADASAIQPVGRHPAEPISEPVPTPRMSEAEQVFEAPPTTQRMPESETSAPGLYGLFDGPESEAFGNKGTAIMPEDAPPTHRRSTTLRMPDQAVSDGIYAAVRSGAYNHGTAGAFNAEVAEPRSRSGVQRQPIHVERPIAPTVPMNGSEGLELAIPRTSVPPTLRQAELEQRRRFTKRWVAITLAILLTVVLVALLIRTQH